MEIFKLVIHNIYLHIMKWRKQVNNPNRNNQTLDSFMSGLVRSTNSQTGVSTTLIPKIKVPASSGLQPVVKPLSSPFMYPEYPQFREYQYSIAIKCVTQNTMVCLPTGLGKTHIASVIMLNFHLWFPQSLIFFLAPTKPLVDQQSMSLSNFSQFISPNCVFSLTGSVQAPKRVKAYQSKRILYCTPQTLQNDLKNKRLDPKKIILLIFDQAHKAVGNYAYTNIIKILDQQSFGFRIIGLSATPGNDHHRIQQVLQNLQISNMVVKSDEDPDVKKYIKSKRIEPIFIQNTTIIREVQQILNQFISWPLKTLLKFRLFDKNFAGGKYGFNPKCYYIISSQINERLSSLPLKLIPLAHSAKNLLRFLADSQSLLRQSGYQSFKRKFIYEIDDLQPEDTIMQKLMPKQQKLNKNFCQAIISHPGYKRIKQLFMGSAKAENHPKLQKLRDILYNFLSSQRSIQNKSKVIVFANLRFSCYQIYKYLNQMPYCEVIKSQIFLGQAKTTVETRNGQESITQTLHLSQKQQIRLIKRYKQNEINTLISTSIGEQGLDIGEVDAIFCYEGGMSNIRMIQRMGRTGRKRDGSVFILLMQGKQSQDYQKATKKTTKMKKTNSQKYKYYSYNPVLFQEFNEIPIKFFKKQQGQQTKRKQILDRVCQVSTKKKINIKNEKKDEKKTRKKIIQEEQSKIQQATFSQQNEEIQNRCKTKQVQQKSEQSQIQIRDNQQTKISRECKKQKYFKITDNLHTKASNIQISSQQEYRDGQTETESEQQQKEEREEQLEYNQEDEHIQYSQQDIQTSQKDSTSDIYSGTVYNKFAQLFDIEKICQQYQESGFDFKQDYKANQNDGRDTNNEPTNLADLLDKYKPIKQLDGEVQEGLLLIEQSSRQEGKLQAQINQKNKEEIKQIQAEQEEDKNNASDTSKQQVIFGQDEEDQDEILFNQYRKLKQRRNLLLSNSSQLNNQSQYGNKISYEQPQNLAISNGSSLVNRPSDQNKLQTQQQQSEKQDVSENSSDIIDKHQQTYTDQFTKL